MSAEAAMSLRGRLLVAAPTLRDPNFERTVVLLCEHSGEGAFGLVLNRLSPFDPREILEEVLDTRGLPELELRRGGPVQTEAVFYLHDGSVAPVGDPLAAGLFFGGDVEGLAALFDGLRGGGDGSGLRLLAGYAGWSAGQLEEEMASSAWVTAPATRELVFGQSGEDLWRAALESLGAKGALSARAPRHPEWN